MAWSEPRAVKADLPLHVYPTAEQADHTLTDDGSGCWCRPDVEHDSRGRPAIVIHRRTHVA